MGESCSSADPKRRRVPCDSSALRCAVATAVREVTTAIADVGELHSTLSAPYGRVQRAEKRYCCRARCVTAAENYALQKIEASGVTGPEKYAVAGVSFTTPVDW